MRSAVAGLVLLLGFGAATAETPMPAPATATPPATESVEASGAETTTTPEKINGDQLLADFASTKACNAGKLMDCAKLNQARCDAAMATGIPECVDALRPDFAGKQLDGFDASFASGRFQGCLLAKVVKASKLPQSKVMTCLMGR